MTVVILYRLSMLPRVRASKGNLALGRDKEGESGGVWPTLKKSILLSPL